MPSLPLPPTPEPPRIWSLDDLNPHYRARLENVLADVKKERVYETIRTEARQVHLFGFGRLYDDPKPRGAVTKVASAMGGWHFYGFGADIVEDDATPWQAPNAFWQELGLAAERHGLVWGGRWKRVDLPHVQMGGIPVSPTVRIRQVYAAEGIRGVWAHLGFPA